MQIQKNKIKKILKYQIIRDKNIKNRQKIGIGMSRKNTIINNIKEVANRKIRKNREAKNKKISQVNMVFNNKKMKKNQNLLQQNPEGKFKKSNKEKMKMNKWLICLDNWKEKAVKVVKRLVNPQETQVVNQKAKADRI